MAVSSLCLCFCLIMVCCKPVSLRQPWCLDRAVFLHASEVVDTFPNAQPAVKAEFAAFSDYQYLVFLVTLPRVSCYGYIFLNYICTKASLPSQKIIVIFLSVYITALLQPSHFLHSSNQLHFNHPRFSTKLGFTS